MKCAVCETELHPREHAQPMTVFGIRCYPRSLCDTCCRANLTAPSSHDALERLARGKADPEKLAALAAATPIDWNEHAFPGENLATDQ